MSTSENSVTAAVSTGPCNYCNESTSQYIPSRKFFLCNTSVECLGKYASLLRSDINDYVARDSAGGPTIIPASSPAPAPAPVPVPVDQPEAAADVHSPLAEIYRWKETESEKGEDESTEEEQSQADEPVDHANLEKTCVLYQENGDEFRVTSYLKGSEPYLTINGANVSFEQFRHLIYDITHYDISPWAPQEEEEEGQLADAESKAFHDEEERHLELQEFYRSVSIIIFTLLVPFILALALSVTA